MQIKFALFDLHLILQIARSDFGLSARGASFKRASSEQLELRSEFRSCDLYDQARHLKRQDQGARGEAEGPRRHVSVY